MRLRQLSAPDAQLLPEFLAFRLQRQRVDGLLVASRRLSLLRLVERKLAEATGEARRAQAVLPRAAYSSVHARQGTHNCKEGGDTQGEGREV